ncbi:Fungal transcriptional regulatory [Cordyceps militaris]|uniref:Fungal transcriptional regulatory n=1 Tax=Cordyceps militaris TaxID=73501 RepID=A0A2H4SRK5_CORMI|nr:Fungal transcriptional regulatory [Cordyceps militaris]
MRLKRGVERASCDFCHGRKIRCDRSVRAARGIDGCSACARRSLACLVTESNHAGRSVRPSPAGRPQSPPSPSSSTLVVSPPAVVPFAAHESLFGLDAESAFFLDQIFMGPLAAAEWTTRDACPGLAPGPAAAAPEEQEPAGIDHYRDTWQGLSRAVFLRAVRAYFAYAALALPLTLEDAFWADVRTGAASAALVCAVACRGMPFTGHRDRWPLQRRLAVRFKDVFLQGQQQQAGGARSTTPLDDVEALALMADFAYDGADVSGPERLFLSKKALVLMALEMRPATTALCRAAERHSLLFWHVYGLDAFACLDAGTASRIPATETLPHLRDTGSGYLDAVLSLALVARAILQTLSESARRGVAYADVAALYERLESWRDVSCPPSLRHWRGGGDEGEHLHVQRAVLHLLRINCYMQIENWASEHGVGAAAMEDQMTGPRIEFESLRAVNEGAELAEWLNGCHVGEFAVVDLAPNILRDINAGLGVWTCLHGIQQLAKSSYHVHGQSLKSALETHLETARLFRSTVATAVSHRDTTAVLDRVDEQVAALQTHIE